MEPADRRFVTLRRALEDRVHDALDEARVANGHTSILVCSVMGLAPVMVRRGEVAVEEAVGQVLALIADVVRWGTVERISETEIAVLLQGHTEAQAQSIRRDVNIGVELLDRTADGFRLGLAVAVGTGPTSPGADSELLWRTSHRAFRLRSTVMQRGFNDMAAACTTLDEVVQRMLGVGLTSFGVRALRYDLDSRSWSNPADGALGEPTGMTPLVTSGRERVGLLHSWSDPDVPLDVASLDEMFTAMANVVERALALESSERRARRDALTGLLNRDGLSHAMREVHAPYAVGVVDIDHFKQMNDQHGHDAGDRCLRALADLLQNGRASDLVARWGGEELVIIMPGTAADGAAAALRRLLERARETIVVEGVPLSFSAGVAVVDDDLLGVLDGIRAADVAMYEAKRNGRGRVVVAGTVAPS